MKPLVYAAALSLVCALPAALHAATDEEVAARNVATGVAGAFSNDGFKLRDGYWAGKFAPHEPKVLQVNLYAGNQYWFSVGASPGATKVAVTVHDEAGHPLPAEPYSDVAKAAAGFAPTVSGPYYIRIEEEEGAPASFCLVYSYK
jgi:hypothetical protein